MIIRRQARIRSVSLITPSISAVVQLSPNHLSKRTWSIIIISQQTLKIILNLVTDNGELAMVIMQVAIIDVNPSEEFLVPSYLQYQYKYHHLLFPQYGNTAQLHRSFHQLYKAHLH